MFIWALMGFAQATVVDGAVDEHLLGGDAGVIEQFGSALASAGDVDGDGYDDLVVGAPQFDGVDIDSGAIVVYYGGPAGLGSRLERIEPIEAGRRDAFGTSVAGAGDVDGDGYDDVIVGAPLDYGVGTDSGSAYLFYGGPAGLDPLSAVKFVAPDTAVLQQFGAAVAGAGDVNADGFADVVVGAPDDDDAGAYWDCGAVHVFYGSPGGLVTSSSDKHLAIDQGDHHRFGSAVAGAGDVDGDGRDDFVVGSADEAAFVYTSLGVDRLEAQTPDWQEEFGSSVSGAGDVNGDGFDDVIVGATKDYAGGVAAGSASVFYGGSWGVDSNNGDLLLPSDLADYDYFGSSVAGAGDVDGDGLADVVVGARFDDEGAVSSGSARVFFGSITGLVAHSLLLDAAAMVADQAGTAVGGGGDVNGDGFDDVFVGVPYADDGGADSGKTLVFVGGSRMGLGATTSCPASGAIELSWTGASPSGQVALVYSPFLGSFAVPSGLCSGLPTGLSGAGVTLIGVFTSDASGDGAVGQTVDSSVCGGVVQLIDLTSCGMTSPISL